MIDHLVDAKIFPWVSEHFGLLVALDKKSGDHQSH